MRDRDRRDHDVIAPLGPHSLDQTRIFGAVRICCMLGGGVSAGIRLNATTPGDMTSNGPPGPETRSGHLEAADAA